MRLLYDTKSSGFVDKLWWTFFSMKLCFEEVDCSDVVFLLRCLFIHTVHTQLLFPCELLFDARTQSVHIDTGFEISGMFLCLDGGCVASMSTLKQRHTYKLYVDYGNKIQTLSTQMKHGLMHITIMSTYGLTMIELVDGKYRVERGKYYTLVVRKAGWTVLNWCLH